MHSSRGQIYIAPNRTAYTTTRQRPPAQANSVASSYPNSHISHNGAAHTHPLHTRWTPCCPPKSTHTQDHICIYRKSYPCQVPEAAAKPSSTRVPQVSKALLQSRLHATRWHVLAIAYIANGGVRNVASPGRYRSVVVHPQPHQQT